MARYGVISAMLCVHSIGGNRLLKLHIYKNNTSIFTNITSAHSGDYHSIPISHIIEFQPNDAIKLMIEALDGSYSIHINSYNIIIHFV